jgi:hypothetical protein
VTELHGYSRGEIFLQNISSFWSKVFNDVDVVTALLDGQAEGLAQAYFNLLEIILAKSVHDIPVFHREKWVLLVFNESDINRNAANLLKYGQDSEYGIQTTASAFAPGLEFEYGGFASGDSTRSPLSSSPREQTFSSAMASSSSKKTPSKTT